MRKFASFFCCRQLARWKLNVLDAVTGMMVMACVWRGLGLFRPILGFIITRATVVAKSRFRSVDTRCNPPRVDWGQD